LRFPAGKNEYTHTGSDGKMHFADNDHTYATPTSTAALRPPH